MYFKLANVCEIDAIENHFDVPFKYPRLSSKEPIINGLNEVSLPIITSDEPKAINFGIWGILPKNFKGNWIDFQNTYNTLNLSQTSLESTLWLKKAFNHRRCIVIVSGFFTSLIHNGEIYPFYVYSKNHKPFALAGVYNILSDGFITFSIVTQNGKGRLKDIHNISDNIPVILNELTYKEWLFTNGSKLLKNPSQNLDSIAPNSHPIAKEFFKNNITYTDILEPYHYSELPLRSLKI